MTCAAACASAHRHDVDANRELVIARPYEHAVDRRDVGIVAADGNDDVVVDAHDLETDGAGLKGSSSAMSRTGAGAAPIRSRRPAGDLQIDQIGKIVEVFGGR
jgi:hypothetical protein